MVERDWQNFDWFFNLDFIDWPNQTEPSQASNESITINSKLMFVGMSGQEYSWYIVWPDVRVLSGQTFSKVA